MVEVLEMTPTQGRVSSQMVQAGDAGCVYGGTKVNGLASVEEAMALSGTNFKVITTPKLYAADKRTLIPGYRGTIGVRPDGEKFGIGAVKSRYAIMQNWDAFKWVQDFLGDGKCISSAGSLHNGRMVFICVDLGDFDVLPGDAINRHLLIMNSHDGSSNILAMLLPNRIVCQNVCNFHGGAPFKIRHTTGAMIRMEEARKVFEIADSNFGEVKEAFQLMAATKITHDQEDQIIYNALGVSDQDRIDFADGNLDRQPHWVNQFLNIREFHADHEGLQIPGVRGSVWGTYNQITGWYDWGRQVRGSDTKPDNIVEAKILGHSAKKKMGAFEACLDFCKS